jgi:hypothetical protein
MVMNWCIKRVTVEKRKDEKVSSNSMHAFKHFHSLTLKL